ncbi:MAG: acyl-CoA thioesterase [Candidatus Neomarinimicrobiota bacterium]
MTPKARPFEVELPFEVKTYDIDFAGIVSNIVYIRWLEDLRLKILADYYPFEKMLAQGFAPVLVRTEIDYQQPVKLLDNVVGRMWASDMGAKKMELTAEFLVDEQVVASARQVGVMISLSDWRPIPLPEELVRIYQEQYR